MRISFSHHTRRLLQQQRQWHRTESALDARRLEQLRARIKKLDQWLRKEFHADWLKQLGVMGIPSLLTMRAIVKKNRSSVGLDKLDYLDELDVMDLSLPQ